MRYVAMVLLLAACSSTTTVTAAPTSSPSASPSYEPKPNICRAANDIGKVAQQLVGEKTMTDDEMVRRLEADRQTLYTAARDFKGEEIGPALRRVGDDAGSLAVRIDQGQDLFAIALDWADTAARHRKTLQQAIDERIDMKPYCL